LLPIIIILKFSNRFKYLVRKSILLRTFLLYKKSIILTVRLTQITKYERPFKYMHLNERLLIKQKIFICEKTRLKIAYLLEVSLF
jgi:hypothetical protein